MANKCVDKLPVAYCKLYPMARAYGFSEVLSLTGATRARLIRWTDRGVISASVQETTGTGNPRLFSYVDLLLIRSAVELVGRFKLTMHTLNWAIQTIKFTLTTDHRCLWLPWLPKGDDAMDSFSFGSVESLGKALASEGLVRQSPDGFTVGIVVDIAAIDQALRSKGATE